MCIIVFKKPEVAITKDKLKFCWDSNKDGAGYMFAHLETQKIIIRKGFMTFDSFYEQWEADKSLTDQVNTVLHFRVATKGKVDQHNCHPHRVSNYMALAHNGTLDYFKEKATEEVSDSRILAGFIKDLPNNWWRNANIMTMLELSIGTNKVVLLNRFNQFTILNEKKGEWREGLWFSNYYHRIPRYRTPVSPNTNIHARHPILVSDIVALGLGTKDRYGDNHYATTCTDINCGFLICTRRRQKAMRTAHNKKITNKLLN